MIDYSADMVLSGEAQEIGIQGSILVYSCIFPCPWTPLTFSTLTFMTVVSRRQTGEKTLHLKSWGPWSSGRWKVFINEDLIQVWNMLQITLHLPSELGHGMIMIKVLRGI